MTNEVGALPQPVAREDGAGSARPARRDRPGGRAPGRAGHEVLDAELGRIALLIAAQTDMRWTTSPRLSLELALIRATIPETDAAPEALVSRLERLERVAGITGRAGRGAGSGPDSPPPSREAAAQASRGGGSRSPSADTLRRRRLRPRPPTPLHLGAGLGRGRGRGRLSHRRSRRGDAIGRVGASSKRHRARSYGGRGRYGPEPTAVAPKGGRLP